MKRLLITVAILAGLSTPVFANQCPERIQQVQQMAIAMPVDKATMVKVADLVKLAKSEHEAGNHEASVKAANEAWKLLGM